MLRSSSLQLESVSVVSLVYKVQQTDTRTGTVIKQGFRTLYVPYGDLGCSAAVAVQVNLNAVCP